jgi:hypothetical protein
LWPYPNRVRSHLWTRPSRPTTRGDRHGRQVRALQRRGWPPNPGRLGPFAALSRQRGHRRRLRRNNGESDRRGSGSALCAVGQSYGELFREVHPRTRQNITQRPSRLGSFQSRPENPWKTRGNRELDVTGRYGWLQKVLLNRHYAGTRWLTNRPHRPYKADTAGNGTTDAGPSEVGGLPATAAATDLAPARRTTNTQPSHRHHRVVHRRERRLDARQRDASTRRACDGTIGATWACWRHDFLIT